MCGQEQETPDAISPVGEPKSGFFLVGRTLCLRRFVCLAAAGLMLALAGSAGAQLGQGNILIEEWLNTGGAVPTMWTLFTPTSIPEKRRPSPTGPRRWTGRMPARTTGAAGMGVATSSRPNRRLHVLDRQRRRQRSLAEHGRDSGQRQDDLQRRRLDELPGLDVKSGLPGTTYMPAHRAESRQEVLRRCLLRGRHRRRLRYRRLGRPGIGARRGGGRQVSGGVHPQSGAVVQGHEPGSGQRQDRSDQSAVPVDRRRDRRDARGVHGHEPDTGCRPSSWVPGPRTCTSTSPA